MDVRISFIIPVYNSEKTVEYSVKSIINHAMDEIEVIIIDDGSSDNSLELCRKMADDDARITVYHKENGGTSLAKNLGIDHAKGKYVFFLDSDDRALMTGINILFNKAEKLEAEGRPCDIIQGFYYRVLDGKKKLVGEGFPNGWISRKGLPDEVSLYHKIKTESAFGYDTNKLYRRDFLNKYNIRFYPHVNKMEDQIFNLEAWTFNPKYYIENQPLFEYWLRSESLSQGSDSAVAEKSIKILEIYYDFLIKKNQLKENLDLLIPLAMRLLCWSLVKNIPFEGSRLELIQPRARVFLNSRAFQFVISDKKHKRELKKLPSFFQRAFFRFCFKCVGRNNGKFISLIMKLGSPIFCAYLNNNVK